MRLPAQGRDADVIRAQDARTGGAHLTKEQKYTDQLRSMGIYQKAFDNAIHTLAVMERELSRVDKQWRKVPEDERYTHALFAVRTALRKDILAHRESLGLTPKGYKRLRPEAKTPPPGGGVNPHSEMLKRLEERCREYDG